MNDQSRRAGPHEPRVEAALREYLERVDRGDPVNREEFLSRHAEIAEALRSFFAAEEPLRKMAVTKISEESAGVSTRSIAAQGQETVPPKPNADRPLGTTGSGLAGQFGRYQIVRALGKGAMGAVYLAQDTQLKRNVAIKTPHFEDDPTGELLKRFYREAEAAATLLHANICPVYDVGEINGKHFISMAYIEGRSLSDLIKSDKAQNERQIVTAIHKLAKALQQAHDHGIVHRDLKPANIMVNKQGEPVIMDFGLARKRRAEGEASLTHSGVLLGSPAYMSPEQIEGDPDNVGPASDQYSLGVVLYEMLTRQLPFRGSVVNVLAQILMKDLTRPSELRPGLDPRIEAVCLRMMAKKTSNRFPSMTAVAEELYAILKSPAAEPVAPQKSATASRSPAAPAPLRGDAGTSQIRKSVKQKALTESDMTSLEELVRKCLRRRDYDQMIQIIERIPEERRNAALQTLLEKARGKADEISFLICEIDEADRLNDAQTALRKADDLLKIKPGHHRAMAIQEKYSGYGEGNAVRIGPLSQFTRPWSEGGWIPWSVLAFALAVFGVALSLIVIQLGKTAVVIDVADPGITVAIAAKGNKIELIAGPTESKVEVEPGEQELKVSYAGLEAKTKRFELKQGRKRRVTVSILNKELVADLDGESLPLFHESEKAGLGQPKRPDAGGESAKVALTPNAAQKQPKAVARAATQLTASAAPVGTPAPVPAKAPSATMPSDGFVSLFNGRDLTGWKTHRSQPGNWRVEDGILISSGADASHLYTERADFKDFDLRVEVRINQGGNSGVIFRAPFGPRWPKKNPKFLLGYEAQIDSSNHPAKTGSLFVVTGGPASGHAVVGIRNPLVPPGQWFSMEIIAQGTHIVIKVDGREVVTRDDSHFARGHIALQQLETQTVAEFRKIEIKEFPTETNAEPAVVQSQDNSFFNGKDLAGWHGLPGFWHVKDHAIFGSVPRGKKAHTFLCSQREYQDFELKFRARLASGIGNSGVQFRSQMKDSRKFTVVGPQCEICGDDAKSGYPSGSLLTEPHGKPDVAPPADLVKGVFKEADFNDFEIRCVGKHVLIKVNGQTTVDADFPSMPDEGIIAWQMHGSRPPREVIFTDIEFTDLSRP